MVSFPGIALWDSEATMDWSLLGFRGLGQVLNIHPVFVHFPIALFPTTLLFYAIGIFGKRKRFLFAGRVCLLLSLLSVTVTVITGLFAADTFPHSETIHKIMETHRTIGYAALFFGFTLSVWSLSQKEGMPKLPRLFLLVLSLAVLMVLQNGDLGGRMVFVEGASVKADSSRHHGDDSEHPHHHGDQ